jgi:flagellar assembly factor FliW
MVTAAMARSFFLSSTSLGDLEWAADSELWFSHGLPGFEQEQRLVPIEIPAQRPLVYLHSATDASICFMALPVHSIAPDLQVQLLPDDYRALDLDPAIEPVAGQDILCLALLGPAECGIQPGVIQTGIIQTNLSSPVVINLHNHRAHQLIPETGPNYWRLGDSGVWEAVCS